MNIGSLDFKTICIIVSGLIAVALLITVITASRMKFTTHAVAVLGMLTALYVVLSFVGTINLYGYKITVDSFPIILASILFGPIGGAIVGLLGSFLNQLISYGLTPTTVLWMLPAIVRGLMVGWYGKYRNIAENRLDLGFILIASSLVVTAINTGVMYLDSVIYHYYTFAYVFGGIFIRVGLGALTAIVMTLIAPPVVKALMGTLKNEQGKMQ